MVNAVGVVEVVKVIRVIKVVKSYQSVGLYRSSDLAQALQTLSQIRFASATRSVGLEINAKTEANASKIDETFVQWKS